MHRLPALSFQDGALHTFDKDESSGDDDKAPKLKDSPCDICLARGAVSNCESRTITIAESEDCPDPDKDRPNSPCSGSEGKDGVHVGIILTV